MDRWIDANDDIETISKRTSSTTSKPYPISKSAGFVKSENSSKSHAL